MKKNLFYLTGSIFIGLLSCKSEKLPELPTLETKAITEINQTSAKSGGDIISDGGSEITAKGICWGINSDPVIQDSHTEDGSGLDSFESILTNLEPDTEYNVRAYATNSIGTGYGNNKNFRTHKPVVTNQIIADHTVVDKFDDIPAEYINEVKKMWLVYAGESHSEAIRTGLALLESAFPAYAVNVVESGTPDAYTTTNLRVSRGTWGDLNNSSGWIYDYGEEDWWTNATAIARTKAGISYCNSNNLIIGAIGFGWCWDAQGLTPTPSTDPVYGVHWYGSSKGGPSGDKYWGIDDGDFSLTSNPVNMDTYLSATQGYIDYCKTNNIPTKVFFTTGPVDDYSDYFGLETMYQATLKYQHIRNYVLADPGRILFDYADILCYDDNGTPTTATWNGHAFPYITNANLGDESIGHIGSTGAIRLAKAMWWMLARMAGWDGN